MALSQLRGIEPATWHWASYGALSQQGSLEFLHISIYTCENLPFDIFDGGFKSTKGNFSSHERTSVFQGGNEISYNSTLEAVG